MGSVLGSATGVTNQAGWGSSGLNYRGQLADIQTPTTDLQAQNQYDSANNALAQQNAFVQAVQAQNGLGNQTNVFNQLQGVANGTGPNPAMDQFNQATAANVANQSALMASQRGAGANPALLARQAAMQGASTQQQAAGQMASLQSQQQLGALNQMGALATNQANQQANAVNSYTGATQAEQGQILGAIGNQNNARVGNQSSVNAGQSSLANIAAQGQQGLLGSIAGGLGSAGVSMPGMGESGGTTYAKGGEVKQPEAPPRLAWGTTELREAPAQGGGGGPSSRVGQFFSSNTINQTPGQSMGQGSMQAVKGLYNAGKAAYNYLSGPSKPAGSPAYGTQPGDLANKGQWNDISHAPDMDAYSSPGQIAEGSVGETAGGAADAFEGASATGEAMEGAEALEAAEAAEASEAAEVMMAAQGGPIQGKKVPALVSPGERYLPPSEVQKVKEGKKKPMEAGVKIPGKPVVGGAKNSYANDFVPATLETGGVVLPRSVTQGKNPDLKAAEFVRAIMAKQGLKGKK